MKLEKLFIRGREGAREGAERVGTTEVGYVPSLDHG